MRELILPKKHLLPLTSSSPTGPRRAGARRADAVAASGPGGPFVKASLLTRLGIGASFAVAWRGRLAPEAHQDSCPGRVSEVDTASPAGGTYLHVH